MNGPLASLTVTIFQYAMGPYKSWHSQAWGAALVITLFILCPHDRRKTHHQMEV